MLKAQWKLLKRHQITAVKAVSPVCSIVKDCRTRGSAWVHAYTYVGSSPLSTWSFPWQEIKKHNSFFPLWNKNGWVSPSSPGRFGISFCEAQSHGLAEMCRLLGIEVTQGARAAAAALRSLWLLCHRLLPSSAAAKFPGFVLRIGRTAFLQ